jgi:hypothetical protein
MTARVDEIASLLPEVHRECDRQVRVIWSQPENDDSWHDWPDRARALVAERAEPPARVRALVAGMQFDKFEPLRRALGRSVSLQRVREAGVWVR